MKEKTKEEAWDTYFQLLYEDIDPSHEFFNIQPKLAHYTSLEVVESIVKNSTIWMSNPLVMNDYQEVSLGIQQSLNIIRSHEEFLASLQTKDRRDIFLRAFFARYEAYRAEEIIDLYVTCFSEYSPTDPDGKLSMWRAYGANGNGAAVVFDTSKLKMLEDFPLVLARVHYGTAEERIGWIKDKISDIALCFRRNDFADHLLPYMADLLFDRILLFSTFTKDSGFSEESEWRLVYLQERDTEKKLRGMMGYFIGKRGIEPKLKLDLNGLGKIYGGDFSLEFLIHSIVLGPTANSPISVMSTKRMLHTLGYSSLVDRVRGASIPYRAT